MAENITIARPYAKALFNWAVEQNKLDAIASNLALLSAIVNDSLAKSLLKSPKLSAQQKSDFLLSFTEQLRNDNGWSNFIRLLVNNNRISYLSSINYSFDMLKKQKEQSVDVTLTSARKLTEESINKFKTVLSEKLKRNVNIEHKTDAGLLAGAIIQYGDNVIDGSARGKLFKLANSLRK